MLPTRKFKMTQQFKVTASTCREVEISNPIVVTEICDPLKSGARYNHAYFILSKHNELLYPSRFKVRKIKKMYIRKGILQTTVCLVSIINLGAVSYFGISYYGSYKVLK